MPRNPVIDYGELKRLLNKGKRPSECAKHFGVSPQAISQAKRKLKGVITKRTATKIAPIVVKENLNTLQELKHINNCVRQILDCAIGWINGDEKSIRVLENQTRKVVYRDRETGEDIELDIVKEIKTKDPRDIVLRASAEIRQQLILQLEIYRTLYDVQAAEEFQKEVLTAIGEVSADVRDRIIKAIKEKRAIRAIIEPGG